MTILAIYSNKGGVGKTATAVNLSYMAAQTGSKTLLCDLDPQSSATYYFRVKPKLRSGVKGFIKGGKKLYRSVKGTDYENLDILPADFSMRNLDLIFNELKRSGKRLKKILEPFKDEYEYIILDCPVTISILAENIFNAADHILIPLIPTTLSVRTYRQLISFCNKIDYDVEGLSAFFSMVDQRKKMHKELMVATAKSFKHILKSFVPYLAQIEKMGIHREPVPVFSPNSIAAKAYENLWIKVQDSIFSTNRNK